MSSVLGSLFGRKTKKKKVPNKNTNVSKRQTKKRIQIIEQFSTFYKYFQNIKKLGITPLDFLNKFYETVNSQTSMVTKIYDDISIKKKDEREKDPLYKSVLLPLFQIAIKMKIDFNPENFFLLLAANLMVLIYTTRNPEFNSLWKTSNYKGYEMPVIKSKTIIIFDRRTFEEFETELNDWFAKSYIGQPIEQIFIINEKKMDPTNKNNSTYSLDRILNKIQIIDRSGAMESYQNLNDDDKTYVFIRAYFRKNPSNVPIVLPTKLSVNLLPYFSGIKTVMEKDKELHEFQGEIGTNVPNTNEVAAKGSFGPVLNPKNQSPTVYVLSPTNTTRLNAFKEGMRGDPSSAAAQPNNPIYDEPGNNSIPPLNGNKSGTYNLIADFGDLSMRKEPYEDPNYNIVEEEPEYVGFNPASPKNKKSGPSRKPDLNIIPENIEPNESKEPVYGSLGVTRDPTSEGYTSLEQEPVYATIDNTGSTPYASPSKANKNVNVGAFQGESTAINPSAIFSNSANKNVNVGAFQGESTAINPNKVFGEPLGKPLPYYEGNNVTFNSSGTRAIPQIRNENLNKRGMPKPLNDEKLKTPTLNISSSIETAGQTLKSLPPGSLYQQPSTFENQLNELPPEGNIIEENVNEFKRNPEIVSHPRRNIEFPGSKSNLNEFQEHTLRQMGSLHSTPLSNNNEFLNSKKEEITGSLGFMPLTKHNGPQLQGSVSDNERPETKPLSKKILIPGKIFNEVTSGVSGRFADAPGKGSTAKKETCENIFDFEKQFDEDDLAVKCKGKNVLIVSHNKRLQRLIGAMFPNFARQQSKKDGCKFGIANCSVLEIYNTGSEAEKPASYPNLLNVKEPQNALPAIQAANANREEQSMTKHFFKLRVLFDGFPDKENCEVVTRKGGAYTRKRGKKGKKGNKSTKKNTRKQRGGAASYHYLKKGDNDVIDEYLTKDEETVIRLEPPPSLFEKMFQEGAQKIILMRHGNGPHNKPYSDKIIRNPPLTALGVYQAYLAGQALNDEGNLFDLDNLFVTTSQLKRAQQTTLQFLVSMFKDDNTKFGNDELDNFIPFCKSCLTNVYNDDTRTILRNKPFIELVSVVENDKNMDINDFRPFVKENNLVNPNQMIKAANTQEKQRERREKVEEAAFEKQRRRIAAAQSAAMKASEATEARIKAEQATANLNKRPIPRPFRPFPPQQPRSRNPRINRRVPVVGVPVIDGPVGYPVSIPIRRQRSLRIGGKKMTKKRNNKKKRITKKRITKKRNHGRVKGNNKKGKGKQTRKR